MINKGSTRIVFIFKKFVIKIPSLYSWENFLNGLLANIQERKFATLGREDLAPIYLSSRLGLFVVMKRARKITEYSEDELWNILNKTYSGSDIYDFMLSDYKITNYGMINNKIVKIDYGN